MTIKSQTKRAASAETKKEIAHGRGVLQNDFTPGRGYTQEDWDDVSDNPEWTEADIKNAKPFKDVFPELYESIQRARGRPPVDTPKKQITLRVDQDVIAKFKATGKGWQSRINEVLKQAKVK
ncbi:BrnA antitoxin family protein [Phyllobacterium meliloti]|uniref:BrnA antitoxin family protein n=1 Tax=Phyllobacterium meliloti TaxID=555317 RepID=UPI001D1507B5|nr:BrnA antitoxin family protein [Phyllobacterium sp. T1293]UGX87612.1 BrnA antitoxin family protein [Phyllobacterium sp. T1293]